MIARLRRLARRARPVPARRLCAVGLHPGPMVAVRVHVTTCGLGTCPGNHPGVRCPVCGATWDLLIGADAESEALR